MAPNDLSLLLFTPLCHSPTSHQSMGPIVYGRIMVWHSQG